MSKNEKKVEQTQEKVMTKYDRKMQQRKDQKAKEKQEKLKSTIISVVVVAVIACLVAYFPIRNYLAVNQTYITVGGKDITKVEYDYNFNLVYNNYLNSFGEFINFFGLDVSKDLSEQMYDDNMTWQDYFDEMTVDNLIQGKAILAQAQAEGFTYDPTEDYKTFEESVKTAAEERGTTVKQFVQASYGPYATLDRISEYVKNDLITGAFYTKKAEDFAPTADEIQAHYDSNQADYDSVDYRVTTIKAELPTEPTDLADAEAENTDTEQYVPSEAEVAKAMADAFALAQAAEAKVAAEGELQENVVKSDAETVIADWLFDNARKAGETTIIEDTENNQYFVLAFEKRYLDETPTADVRVIMLEEDKGQAILDEWKSGEATEESFAELCKKYSVDTSTEDGLFEGVVKSGMPEEIGTWLFDTARVTGDVVSVNSADGLSTYVMYYVGQNEPEWKLKIETTLSTNALNEYISKGEEGITVEDPKGNLNYLKIQEAVAESEEAAAE